MSVVRAEPVLADAPTTVAVVETKAGSTPTAVDRALWRLGHRPMQISKYGAGMVTTHADLPHLKWHRTLTNPLLAHAS